MQMKMTKVAVFADSFTVPSIVTICYYVPKRNRCFGQQNCFRQSNYGRLPTNKYAIAFKFRQPVRVVGCLGPQEAFGEH